MPAEIQGNATVVGPESYLQRMITDDKYFAKPYFNNIFVMSSDYVNMDSRPPYYGDTITMQGWNFLKIPFGEIDDEEEVLTRIDGWEYIYDRSKNTFDAIDENGNIYIHRDNIQTIGDLHIDFTIQMSHQFKILVDSSDIFDFILTAKLNKKVYGESYMWKPRFETGDKLYGYDNRHSLVNSNATSKRITFVDTYTLDINIPIKVVVYETSDIVPTMSSNVDNGITNAVSTAKVYDDTFKTKSVKFIKPKYNATIIKYSLLYFMLSNCMYPRLNITIKVGETHNNRPLYEPWLIWGVFKFLFLHKEEVDNDEYDIPVFDLSPNWGY